MVEDPKRHNEVAVFTGKKDLPHPELASLPPGYVIEFSDIRELIAFEDLIAAAVDPKHDPKLWATRTSLRDLIRPQKVKIRGKNKPFNGTIRNIKLIVMADPYEQLLSAKDRGWRGQGGNSVGIRHELSSDLAGLLIPRYKGFKLIADATQSGLGKIGRLQGELWYFPFPPQNISGKIRKKSYRLKSGEVRYYDHTDKEGSISRRGKTQGAEISRVVTYLKMKTDKFIQMTENSERVAESLAKHNVNYPLRNPMRD